MLRLVVCLQLVVLGFFSTLVSAASVETAYTVAVVPQFPARIIQREWTPLLEEIKEKSGLDLKLKFYSSIPVFEKGFLAGEPDFVYMNPYHVVMARKAQGYVPIVREGERQLVGILTVKKDSPFEKLSELDGQVVVFPSPNALAASLYMRALLAEKENIRIVPKYVKTHSNVYRHVLLGKAAAGGGVNKTLKKESESLQGALRIFYKTPGLAPHPICVHPRISKVVADRFVAAIFSLSRVDGGRKILEGVAIPNPLRADYQRDYEPLEKLGLENFLVKD